MHTVTEGRATRETQRRRPQVRVGALEESLLLFIGDARSVAYVFECLLNLGDVCCSKFQLRDQPRYIPKRHAFYEHLRTVVGLGYSVSRTVTRARCLGRLTSLYSLSDLIRFDLPVDGGFDTYLADSTPAKFVRMQVSSTPSTPLASFFSLNTLRDLRTCAAVQTPLFDRIVYTYLPNKFPVIVNVFFDDFPFIELHVFVQR